MRDEILEDFVLVLNIFEKNKNDVIIKTMSHKSIIYFLVKGFQKQESKNRLNILPGSYIECEYFPQYGKDNYFLLKKATLKKTIDISDEKNLFFYKKLVFLLQKLENHSLIIFEKFIEFLNDFNIYNSTFFLTYILDKILKTKGFIFNYNYCSICKSNQNLHSINLKEGGILCVKHKQINSILDLDVVKSFYFLNQNFLDYTKNSNLKTNSILFNQLFSFL